MSSSIGLNLHFPCNTILRILLGKTFILYHSVVNDLICGHGLFECERNSNSATNKLLK